MKKNFSAIFVVLLLVSLVISCGRVEVKPGKKKIKLRLNLEEGKTYKLLIEAEQEISQTVMGNKVDMTQIMNFVCSYKVKEIDSDGNFLLEVSYDSVYFKQVSPMGTIEYDSNNPPEIIPDMAKGFDSLVGEKYSFLISPSGKVIDIYGVDEMIDNMIKVLNIPDEKIKVQMFESIIKQFGKESLKEMLEQYMKIYPDKVVGIGDSWQVEMVLSKGFPFIIENTYTLKGRGNGISTVSVNSIVKPNPEGEPIEMLGMKLGYELSGTQNGTMEIDEATGWILNSELNQNISGIIKFKQSTQTTEEMTWPISIKSTIKYKSY
jgi:citrate lyase gamma subunit